MSNTMMLIFVLNFAAVALAAFSLGMRLGMSMICAVCKTPIRKHVCPATTKGTP